MSTEILKFQVLEIEDDVMDGELGGRDSAVSVSWCDNSPSNLSLVFC
ncbi:SapB/AmfS family lanthipeptide [Enterococcus faecium]